MPSTNPTAPTRLLDEAGLKWDSQHRYRLTPEGQRFLSVVIFNRQDYPVELLEFVRQDWARVGIEVNMKETDFRFREWTCRAGNQDCTCWNADLVEEIAAYLPWRTKWNPQEVLFYALDWWLWYYNNGASGTEPPEEWKDQFNRMADWYRAKDEEEYRRLGRAVWDFFTRQLVFIGTVGYAPQPVAIKNGPEERAGQHHDGLRDRLGAVLWRPNVFLGWAGGTWLRQAPTGCRSCAIFPSACYGPPWCWCSFPSSRSW